MIQLEGESISRHASQYKNVDSQSSFPRWSQEKFSLTLESRGQTVVNLYGTRQKRGHLLEFMSFVKNNSKQNWAKHTAQDDSQSYSSSILLFALFKKQREFGIDSIDFGLDGCQCCKISYRKVLKNDLIQQGWHGVKYTHVDTISKQE